MKIFVYGSLMRGFPNHHLIEEGNAQFLGVHESEEKLYMVGLRSGAYPYLIDEPVHPTCQATTIKGEVYEVTYDLIQRLDLFEGHPHHYTRTPIIVYQDDRFKPTIAYTYMVIHEFMKDEIAVAFEERFVTVPSGDWKKNFIVENATS
jgi:gamma-glutamylcyclotransferase (GGCT)/AIG2-like uncharacterized protein YtfP